jgi:hypothetical protein
MSRSALQHAPQSARESAGTSLRIGPAHDAYEREADQAAEKVTSGESQRVAWSLSRVGLGPVQRECSCGETCDDCKKKREMVQRYATSSAAIGGSAPASVSRVLSRPGSALDGGTRSFMESRFCYDFSRVRIHTDSQAAESARDVSANAYTVGSSIVFSHGRFQPHSPSGRKLLAHELAHVVQQSQGSVPAQIQRDPDEVQTVDDAPKSNSALQQAFDAADARRWEVAARLANGLSPYEMKIFLSQYPQPMWRHQLHLGAVSAAGVGDKSAIALATEKESADFKRKEDFKYRQQLAKQNGDPPPSEDGSQDIPNGPTRALTAEEKKLQCESSQSKGVMTFPLRLPRGLWRISVAPISAHRSGEEIVVSQPLNGVLGDPMFKQEVKTLPLSTFTGGVHLAPDDYVRVRFYDDNDRVACVSGEQMLKMSEASDTAVMLSIARTALDAASLLAPGAGEALVNRGFSAAAARLTVAGANLALNEGLEVAQQGANVHYGIQDQIHWGQIAFETVLQAVTIGLGGKLSEAAAERVAGVATGTYTKPLLTAAVETVLQGSIAVVQSVARTLFNKLQGESEPTTFGEFMEELAAEFAQGALFHLVMQAIPEGESGPHTNEQGTAKPAKGAGEIGEHQNPKPVKQEHETAAPPTAKKQTVKSGMENEASASPTAIPKDEALATVEIEDPKTHEKHEIVGSKKGLGRCSDSPCPAIPVVYQKELAENPAFATRYKKIRELGETNVTEATNQAAALASEIEAYKLAKASASGPGTAAALGGAGLPAKQQAANDNASTAAISAGKQRAANDNAPPPSALDSLPGLAAKGPANTNAVAGPEISIHSTSGNAWVTTEGEVKVQGTFTKVRSKYEQTEVAGGTGDDAGHNLAASLGGPAGRENLARQNRDMNQAGGTWRDLEIQFGEATANGFKVWPRVSNVYRPEDHGRASWDANFAKDLDEHPKDYRPYRRHVEWTITDSLGNVEHGERDFVNTKTPLVREIEKAKNPPTP